MIAVQSRSVPSSTHRQLVRYLVAVGFAAALLTGGLVAAREAVAATLYPVVANVFQQ